MSRAVFPLLLLAAPVFAGGQPEWLAPFPQVREQVVAVNGISSYTAMAPIPDVVAYYERDLRASGIEFKAQSDGIGISIIATAGKESAVIELTEDGGATRVKVAYAVTPDPPPAAPISRLEIAPAVAAPPAPAPTPAAALAAAPANKPKAVSPYQKEPFTWIMKSKRIPGKIPAKYVGGYYEAQTEATVDKPLKLPKGARIVDVSPRDCVFNMEDKARMEDKAKHFLTFKKADAAIGTDLVPGTWSVYPMRCQSIQIYLQQ